MTILIAPNGERYESHNRAEINTLVLGHGYKIATDETPDTADVNVWGQADPVRTSTEDEPPTTAPDPDSLAY